jgi:ankyrin repeat protein
MMRLLCWGVFVLLGTGAFSSSEAQTYRCVDGGKVVYSDRPCSDNVKPVDIGLPTGAASRIGEDTQPRTSPISDARSDWDPAKHGGETYEAHQKSQLQGKLVQCIVDEYNAWSRTQKARPSSEAREAQMAKVREECRQRFPGGVNVLPPEPRQTSADLDAFRNAIKSGKLEAVKGLLDAKVDPNSVFTAADPIRKELRTPALIFSVNNSTEDVTRLLVERGANIGAFDTYGNTALHAAAERGQIKTIDLLLSRGADLAVRGPSSYTPLHSAIHGMKLEAVKYLVAKGAPIDAQASHYGTPLMDAVIGNRRDDRLPIIRHLLQSGANPNIPGANGDHVLHVAIVGRGNQAMIEVIHALLDAGAKLDVLNSRGETPLALAERLGRGDVIELLKASSSRK